MTSDEDVAVDAAEYAVSFELDNVPDAIRERAELVFLDTVGVCFRGSMTEYVREVTHALAVLGNGMLVERGVGATTFATGDRRPVGTATLCNAAGGTSLELDEGNQRSAHPGIHTVPPALAIAEHYGASGQELLEALIVGYEVGARLGDLVRPLKEGLHPHGAWAPVSGAVAAGRLLGLDVEELAHAVRIAVNPFITSHWKAALTGATVRNFYTGICCQHGIQSAVLAAAGVEGVEGAVEECLLPYTASRDLSESLLTSTFGSLGESYYLSSSYFKMHAACRYSHAPVEAFAALQAAEGFDPDRTRRITVDTFELGTLLNERKPQNVLAAKFSTPYVIAARAYTGRSDATAFTEKLVADESIRSLARRVNVIADPVFTEAAANGRWGARVEVELNDGTVQSETVVDARGGGENPYTRKEVFEKFDALVAEASLTVDPVTLRKRLLDVGTCEKLTELLAPLRA